MHQISTQSSSIAFTRTANRTSYSWLEPRCALIVAQQAATLPLASIAGSRFLHACTGSLRYRPPSAPPSTDARVLYRSEVWTGVVPWVYQSIVQPRSCSSLAPFGCRGRPRSFAFARTLTGAKKTPSSTHLVKHLQAKRQWSSYSHSRGPPSSSDSRRDSICHLLEESCAPFWMTFLSSWRQVRGGKCSLVACFFLLNAVCVCVTERPRTNRWTSGFKFLRQLSPAGSPNSASCSFAPLYVLIFWGSAAGKYTQRSPSLTLPPSSFLSVLKRAFPGISTSLRLSHLDLYSFDFSGLSWAQAWRLCLLALACPSFVWRILSTSPTLSTGKVLSHTTVHPCWLHPFYPPNG